MSRGRWRALGLSVRGTATPIIADGACRSEAEGRVPRSADLILAARDDTAARRAAPARPLSGGALEALLLHRFGETALNTELINDLK